MPVAVDVARAAADRLLECGELRPDLGAQGPPIQALQQAAENPALQRTGHARVERKFGEVQVKAEFDPVRIEAVQQRLPLVPRRAADHAADGLHMAHSRQADRGLADAGMQAEVVGRDADAARAAMLGRSMRHPRHRRPTPAVQRGRLGWFVAVGCAAALVHWLVVVALVSLWHGPPLLANVAGWLTAFTVSFAGHHRLTFGGHGVPIRTSARRFLVVSASGFAINEATYATLLRWSPVRYDLALAIVLVAVAAATYLLSRHWAFLRTEAR